MRRSTRSWLSGACAPPGVPPRLRSCLRCGNRFTKAHELLESSGLTREQIRTAVASANIELRPGVQELLHLLDEHNVPMLVFSAGIGGQKCAHAALALRCRLTRLAAPDILLEVMRQQASLPNNVHIVSNRMQFDNSGRLVRFREPLFHVYNKRAAAIQHEPYFKEVVSRRNLILLGDNLGDLSMSEGAQRSVPRRSCPLLLAS